MNNKNKNWYSIKNIDTIDSPALVVYKERVRQNILLLKKMAKNIDALRPHVKTNKMAEVCRMMMDEGIYKFKCATVAEAEMLASINAKDVLLAYQPVGPKVLRLLALVKKYPSVKFSCLIDNTDSAAHISKIFLQENSSLNVYIDLNTGMNRTGIKPENVLQLFKAVESMPNITIVGLHGYDGHVRDTDIKVRKLNADKAFNEIVTAKKIIEQESKRQMKIIVSGSPAFPVHAKRENVECSPGTFVFWDWGYKNSFPDEPFEYAALVITRVISVIDDETICLDLGHKSVAAENTIDKRIHFLNAPDVVPVSQSEEHLVARVSEDSHFKVGDVLYGVPVHICPTVALYERAIVVEKNIAVDEWKVVARDRKISV